MVIMGYLKHVSREAGIKELKNVPEMDFAPRRKNSSAQLRIQSKFSWYQPFPAGAPLRAVVARTFPKLD
jgi:hypothetical protein